MRSQFAAAIVTALLGLLALSALTSADEKKDDVLAGWNTDFAAEKPDLAPTGRNPYFILEPGYVLILEGGDQSLFTFAGTGADNSIYNDDLDLEDYSTNSNGSGSSPRWPCSTARPAPAAVRRESDFAGASGCAP